MITQSMAIPLLLVLVLHRKYLRILQILLPHALHLPLLLRNLLHQLIDCLLQHQDLGSHLLFLPRLAHTRFADRTVLLQVLGNEVVAWLPRAHNPTEIGALAVIDIFNKLLPREVYGGDSWKRPSFLYLDFSSFCAEDSHYFFPSFEAHFLVILLF